MPSAKTATLSSLLVSKKGNGVLRPAHPGLEDAQSIPSTSDRHDQSGFLNASASEATSRKVDVGYYKALTLKVDKPRFTKLKTLGVQLDLRSQALMTEALDLLFDKHQL